MQDRLNQLIIVRYEDLIARLSDVLNQISRFCELPEYKFSISHIDENSALKHRHLLSNELIEAIKIQANETREYFGYLDK